MQAHSTTPATPLLQVRGLQVRFGAKSVVRGVGFEIARGEKLALVGESGSGKTITALSLLRLLGDAAVEGQALFAGRDLLQLSEREMRGVRGGDIAMVFQEPMTALNPLMTIGQQIAEILMLKKGLTGAECAQAAIELLAKTGIPEPARRAGSFPHQLSGGQRQRAMIAMALASEPQLLLADEPTTALDVTLRGQILDLLSDLQRQTGMAVLLITHDLNLVRRFADRVAVMEQGVLVEQGAVAEVFANPQHPYTRRLITSQPRRDVVEAAPPAGTPPVVQARQLRVAYPTPLPGVRGWFKKGE
ncbi:MAG: ABC transporter ATP-binding protein, partial [Acidovorax sp.]|nr:ABC transporter ATP-binding protein [Acidovorax sp.]